MSRILVVYYSRTGYTRDIAGELAAAVQGDVDRLDDGLDRTGVWGYLRCAREGLKKRTVQLMPPAYDASRYDVVVLGTPVWAGNISSPVRSYVAANRAKLKQVAFFCTQGGSGAEKVFRDLETLCRKSSLATLALSDREINAHTYAQRLERFATAVTAAVVPARSLNLGGKERATA
jgi:flavodoxin